MEQTIVQQDQKEMKSLRFGGISPVVLRELSGVYQPFVKAVKELVSNAYDADAPSVNLFFQDDYNKLAIEDNGCGMNPIEFVRDYIRIGKSVQKNEMTNGGRPRIGGKGIGFLAPARYCEYVEIETKKSKASTDQFVVDLNGFEGEYDLTPYFLQGHNESRILKKIEIKSAIDQDGNAIKFDPETKVLTIDKPTASCEVVYRFNSSSIKVVARIDFELLFSLDPSKSLEEVSNFCQIRIEDANEADKERSYTRITLHEIKEFVRNELSKKGKKGARNIESHSGIEQFLWNLSRIIPVKAEHRANFPETLSTFIHTEIDEQAFQVNFCLNDLAPQPLERYIIEPSTKLDMDADSDLVKQLDINEAGITAKGFLVGQSTTIYPAECRGILLRVKGVAIGEPTYFGLDQTLTGSSKVALSQISGEINIMTGIDAIYDINPGRDGFYKESVVYNFIKTKLIGDDPDKLSGDLKNVIDAIVSRSEVNASITNFVKRYEAQRSAIFEASAAIAELSIDAPEIIDEFFEQKDSYELTLTATVPYKAEGKLAAYTVKVVEDITDQYKIDYVSKELLLNKHADIWKKNIDIGGTDFEIILKQGKQRSMFCEVNPKQEKIYINWDHPMRGTMGDAGFIKHCLATVASALPQEQLNTYIRLITNKF